MTVYNITKTIDKGIIKGIKKYLNIEKVVILYTDWGNEFGVRAGKGTDKKRLSIVSQMLWDKLKSEPITKFTECPKVDVHRADLIKHYGRTKLLQQA